MYTFIYFLLVKKLGHSCGMLDNKVGRLVPPKDPTEENLLLEPRLCWVLKLFV